MSEILQSTVQIILVVSLCTGAFIFGLPLWSEANKEQKQFLFIMSGPVWWTIIALFYVLRPVWFFIKKFYDSIGNI